MEEFTVAPEACRPGNRASSPSWSMPETGGTFPGFGYEGLQEIARKK